MTRFARARGSKGSNEKVPEKATSWQVMKRQLQESEVKQENSSTPARSNVQQLLNDDATNSTSKWAIIEETQDKPENSCVTKVKRKRLSSEKNALSKTVSGKVKKPKKFKLKKTNVSDMIQSNNIKQESPTGKKTKSPALNNVSQVSSVKETGTGVRKKKRSGNDENNGNSVSNNLPKKRKLTKKEKIEKGKSFQRRKPALNNMIMTVDGREIPLSYFDGFVVKKEDAERLTELQKKLTEKGISKEEVKEVLKLERRKAEKALARERKKVCYHCRKSGHILSACPELGDAVESSGICYKCGSTEHRSYECRVGKSSQYRFATCFVCSEQGHISAQCPKNAKGLYPKGGSCHVCGDVTHLKKDCPKLEQEQESQGITLEKIGEGSLEALDVKTKSKFAKNVKKGKQAKRVSF